MTRFIIRTTPPSFSEVAGYVAQSVVAIAVGLRLDSGEPNIIGTGFALGLSEYYVTCWHVLHEHEKLLKLSQTELAQQGLKDNTLRIALPEQNNYVWREVEPYAWLRGYTEKADLCILRLVGITIPPLTLYDGQFSVGHEVGLIGFPLGTRLQGTDLRPLVLKTVVSGGVEPTPANKLKSSRLALGTSVAGGFSGGPVFSSIDGSVMGMIASITLEPEPSGKGIWPAGISLAVPLGDLRFCLESGIKVTSATIKRCLQHQLKEEEQSVHLLPP